MEYPQHLISTTDIADRMAELHKSLVAKEGILRATSDSLRSMPSSPSPPRAPHLLELEPC